MDNQAPGGIGYAFRFTPDGQTFTKPVTLTYTPVENDLAVTTPAAVGLAYQTAAGTWQVLPGTSYSAASNSFTTSTTHFTDYSYYASFHLYAEHPFGLLTGGSSHVSVVQVVVDRCSGSSPDDCLGEPGDVNVVNGSAITWAVNGQTGGDGTHGTVTSGANPATYTAPAAVPADNLVAVSATLTPDGGSTLKLVKNLLVLAHQYHVEAVFEDQTTCDPLPNGGKPVFAYDIFTGGNFNLTLNQDLNATAGDLVSTTDDPPLTGGPFANCIQGGGATYNPGGTHGLQIDAAPTGLSSSSGRFNVTIMGAYSGQPAATLTYPGGSQQSLNEDRSSGSIAGFMFQGKPNEKVVISAGNSINIFKKRSYTLSIKQQ